MSECLHCDINELVCDYLKSNSDFNLPDLVTKMAESLAELIMLGPKEEWSRLMGEATLQMGQVLLKEENNLERETAH